MNRLRAAYLITLAGVYAWYFFVLNKDGEFERHCSKRGRLWHTLFVSVRAILWLSLIMYVRMWWTCRTGPTLSECR